MKRLLFLAIVVVGALLVFATAAVAAQDVTPGKIEPPVMETEEAFGQPEVIETPLEEAIEEPVEEAIKSDAPEPPAEEKIEEKAQEQVKVKGDVKVEPKGGGQTVIIAEETIGLPPSGGPAVASVLLPAAALLLGSGILAYAILRRR